MRPSSCQTVRKRSQSPASRHTAQFSTRSRIARRSAVAEGSGTTPSYARAMLDTTTIGERDLRDETTALLRDLLRVDTANPPGRETAAATLLKDYLEASGVECELVARDPDRREPGRAHPRHRRRPVAGAVRPHRRRAGRPAGLDAPAVRRAPRRRRLAVGPRRRRHEEPDRDARRGDGRPGPLRVQPEGDLLFIAQADEEDGVEDVGMRWLVARAARPPRRLRHQRGRRRPADAGRRPRRSSRSSRPEGDAAGRRDRARRGRRTPRARRPGRTPCRASPSSSGASPPTGRRGGCCPRRRGCSRCWPGPGGDLDDADRARAGAARRSRESLPPLFSTTMAPTRLRGSTRAT